MSSLPQYIKAMFTDFGCYIFYVYNIVERIGIDQFLDFTKCPFSHYTVLYEAFIPVGPLSLKLSLLLKIVNVTVQRPYIVCLHLSSIFISVLHFG